MPTGKSSAADLAHITPTVLTWALNHSRLNREQIAEKLRVTSAQLASWERGIAPPFSKAEQLASILHIPFGCFFLSSPPADSLPVADFRGKGAGRASQELRELLNDLLVRRDWYRDFITETS